MTVLFMILLAVLIAAVLLVLAAFLWLAAVMNRVLRALEETPRVHSKPEETEEDVRRSRAVEDGIASILQYAAGKVPGVEVEL